MISGTLWLYLKDLGSLCRDFRYTARSDQQQQNTEYGLVAGKVPVHLLSTAEVPLSKEPNPPTAMGVRWLPRCFANSHILHGTVCACISSVRVYIVISLLRNNKVCFFPLSLLPPTQKEETLMYSNI